MGGNVFKGPSGESATRRISREEVYPTVQWLEKISGLELTDNMLGSTGREKTSGDLDIAVDQEIVSARDFKQALDTWVLNRGETDLRGNVHKSGDMVHLKTPIAGDPNKGYVQTDFMFGNPIWLKFAFAGGIPGSPWRGKHRNQLVSSIAKARNPDWKWSAKNGLRSRTNNEHIALTPQEITDAILGPGYKPSNMMSVESIFQAIKKSPNFSELIAHFKKDIDSDPEAPRLESLFEGTLEWHSRLKLILENG